MPETPIKVTSQNQWIQVSDDEILEDFQERLRLADDLATAREGEGSWCDEALRLKARVQELERHLSAATDLLSNANAPTREWTVRYLDFLDSVKPVA